MEKVKNLNPIKKQEQPAEMSMMDHFRNGNMTAFGEQTREHNLGVRESQREMDQAQQDYMAVSGRAYWEN
jgi:hypothetical protein